MKFAGKRILAASKSTGSATRQARAKPNTGTLAASQGDARPSELHFQSYAPFEEYVLNSITKNGQGAWRLRKGQKTPKGVDLPGEIVRKKFPALFMGNAHGLNFEGASRALETMGDVNLNVEVASRYFTADSFDRMAKALAGGKIDFDVLEAEKKRHALINPNTVYLIVAHSTEPKKKALSQEDLAKGVHGILAIPGWLLLQSGYVSKSAPDEDSTTAFSYVGQTGKKQNPIRENIVLPKSAAKSIRVFRPGEYNLLEPYLVSTVRPREERDSLMPDFRNGFRRPVTHADMIKLISRDTTVRGSDYWASALPNSKAHAMDDATVKNFKINHGGTDPVNEAADVIVSRLESMLRKPARRPVPGLFGPMQPDQPDAIALFEKSNSTFRFLDAGIGNSTILSEIRSKLPTVLLANGRFRSMLNRHLSESPQGRLMSDGERVDFIDKWLGNTLELHGLDIRESLGFGSTEYHTSPTIGLPHGRPRGIYVHDKNIQMHDNVLFSNMEQYFRDFFGRTGRGKSASGSDRPFDLVLSTKSVMGVPAFFHSMVLGSLFRLTRDRLYANLDPNAITNMVSGRRALTALLSAQKVDVRIVPVDRVKGEASANFADSVQIRRRPNSPNSLVLPGLAAEDMGKVLDLYSGAAQNLLNLHAQTTGLRPDSRAASVFQSHAPISGRPSFDSLAGDAYSRMAQLAHVEAAYSAAQKSFDPDVRKQIRGPTVMWSANANRLLRDIVTERNKSAARVLGRAG